MEKYHLKNLDCPSCALVLESGIKKMDCVSDVTIDFNTLTMNITTTDMEKVKGLIHSLEPDVNVSKIDTGLPAGSKGVSNPLRENIGKIIWLSISFILYFTAIIFLNIFHSLNSLPLLYGIFIPIYIIAGYKVIYKAITNILRGNIFSEYFLMTIATIAALVLGNILEAVGVMLFYTLGEFIQDLAVNKSRGRIQSLIALKPKYANLWSDAGTSKINPENAKINDILLVQPGEMIPLDGEILEGSTLVNSSSLTGESLPKDVKKGERVFAGEINLESTIKLAVRKTYSDSSLSKIMTLVEGALKKKSRIENFISVFSKYYTPVVVFAAIFTALLPPLLISGQQFVTWVYRALIMLVVSCPCALVISIPLSFFGGLGKASKEGILIKGSLILDKLVKMKTVIFDKTGTLTKGIFEVVTIKPYNNFSVDDLLYYIYRAEEQSTHPIAIAVKKEYGKNPVGQDKRIGKNKASSFKIIRGKGVEADFGNHRIIAGNDSLLHDYNIEHTTCSVPGTVVHAAVDGIYAGYLIIRDEIKKSTIPALKKLKKLGIKNIIMLTGDNKETARQISEEIDLPHFHAELLPEHKLYILESHINTNHFTGFVGDGINDAPALARSDIGFAMGSLGTEAAMETGDIVIMNDSLEKIPEAVEIARKTRSILIQNIIFALGVKLFFIILGFLGKATMWEAVFSDVGVALLAIFNTFRIIYKKYNTA